MVLSGEHPQKQAKEREVIEYLVTKVLKPAALPQWWNTPLTYAPPPLTRLTPNQAMLQGLGRELHEYVKNYSDPRFT